MRVVQINAVYGILSTGVTTKQLSHFMSDNGIPNIAIYGLHKQDDNKKYFIGSFIGRKIDILATRLFKLSGYFSIISTLKAVYYIWRFKPDIIHLRVLHEYFINLPLLLKYIAYKQIATVITLHDCYMFTGACPYYTINKCEKWKNNCSNCNFYNLNTEKMFGDKLMLMSNIKRLAVVGVSDWVTNEAKNSKILGHALIIKRIYNWINLDIFKPIDKSISSAFRTEIGIKESTFVVLCVSAVWSTRKRLNDICSVAKILGDDYSFVVVGSISDESLLPNNVVHIPTIYDIRDLPKYYSMADVFLHLSLEETFGKVTAEALSCGTPAVVYKSTASPELVPDGCGHVIETIGDIDSITKAIELVKMSGKDSYSNKCRLFAEANFNMLVNIEEYIDLYHRLLN